MDRPEGRAGERERGTTLKSGSSLRPPGRLPFQCQGVRRPHWAPQGQSDVCWGSGIPLPRGWAVLPSSAALNCSVSSSCYYSDPHYRDLSSRSSTTTTQPVTQLHRETGHSSGAAGGQSEQPGEEELMPSGVSRRGCSPFWMSALSLFCPPSSYYHPYRRRAANCLLQAAACH